MTGDRHEKDAFDHPMREGAVLELKVEEPGVSRLVFITSRLLDIDTGHYQYKLVDYSNTYQWQYHEEDVDYMFRDTGHTSTDTKIYQSMQPGLYEALQREYGDLGTFPHGTPEVIRS